MLEKWTGEVKGTMHIYEISMDELADRIGISATFLSSLLHCRKRTKDGEFKVRNALMEIVNERTSAEQKIGRKEEAN